MIEAYLRDSGAGWTNLHPNMFMQNLLAGWRVKGGLYSVYTSKPIGFTALEDVAEAAAAILMEGPEKHSGKDYWFSADVLDPQQVAETLTAATGRKFTAAVRDHDHFLKEMALPTGSTFEPAYAKGGIELFREVEHGRMAYIGSVADDTKTVLVLQRRFPCPTSHAPPPLGATSLAVACGRSTIALPTPMGPSQDFVGVPDAYLQQVD